MTATRRGVLGMAVAGAASTAQAGAAIESAAPPDVGRKFQPDGRVMRFAGNTVICHLPQQGAGAGPFHAVLDVYRDLAVRGFSANMALLPPSSYHMTVFGGANDGNRQPGLWPAGLALDAPMSTCHRWIADRLRNLGLKTEPPLRMRVSDAEAAPAAGPIQIALEPVDAAEAAKLRDLRDRLSVALGIRAPDHDRYRFHVTLAYLIRWLSAEQQADYAAAQRTWRAQLRRAAPVFHLGAPEYCLFEDMFAFHTQFHLS